MSAPAATLRQDSTIIGLIGLAHGASHFFQLVLPPLFPLLKAEFDVSYAELGALMMVFYTISGVCQTLAGFAVDRYGARRVLLFGVAAMASSVLLMAIAPGFWLLAACVVLAGFGNSVFHPSDFTILNSRIDPRRLGHAFSVHGISGSLGWAAAPLTVTALGAALGWRGALFTLGAAGLLLFGLLFASRRFISTAAELARTTSGAPASGAATTRAKATGGLLPLLTTTSPTALSSATRL